MRRKYNSENVVFQTNIFRMENNKKGKVYIGILAGLWNKASTIVDSLFPTIFSETKLLYRAVLGVSAIVL